MCPPKYADVLTSSPEHMTSSGNRGIIGKKRPHWGGVGPSPSVTVPVRREERQTRDGKTEAPAELGRGAQERGQVQSEGGGREDVLQEHKTIHFCGLSHHVCGALRQEPPERTHRAKGRPQIWRKCL